MHLDQKPPAKCLAVAQTREVICKTFDKQKIPVDIDVLRLSHTFDTTFQDMRLREDDVFPGIYPVTKVDSRVFEKVVGWCKEHKGSDNLLLTRLDRLF